MPARRSNRSALLAALAVAALLLPACGGGAATGSATSADGDPSATAEPSAGAEDSILAMLALLPPIDPEDLGTVVVSRWHAAAEAYGVDVPAADAPTDEVVDYLRALSSSEGGVVEASDLMALRTAASRPIRDEFGWSQPQIAADIVAGQVPQQHHAAQGDFDVEAIVGTTLSGPVADEVAEVEVQGVPVLRWREDGEGDLRATTSLTPTGAAGRLGLPDASTLLYTGYDEGIEAMVEAWQGGPSLADDEHLAAIAGALDAQGALSALLLHRFSGSDLPYEAVGAGLAEDDGPRMLLVYSTGSESDAQTVATEVQELVTAGTMARNDRPWSELLTDPDIGTEGSLVTASFALRSPAAQWAAFVLTQENLF